MEFACPRCESSFDLPREDLASPVRAAPCPDCGATLVFVKRPAVPEEAPGGAAAASSSSSSRPQRRRRDLLRHRRSRDRLFSWGMGAITVAVTFGGGSWVLSTFKGSPAYQAGQAFVRENEEIRTRVGSPMEFGWFPEGSISDDEAELQFSVEGALGEADVVVRLVRTPEGWRPVEAAFRSGGEGGPLPVPGGAALAAAASGDLPSIRGAWDLLENGQPDEALALIDLRIEMDAGNAEAHYWRGRMLSRMERPGEAIAAFRRAVELRPDYPEAYRSLGFHLATAGRPAEAVDALDEAIRLDPTNGWAHYNRARAHHELGNPREAFRGVRRSCELGYERGCEVYRQLPGGGERP